MRTLVLRWLGITPLQEQRQHALSAEDDLLEEAERLRVTAHKAARTMHTVYTVVWWLLPIITVILGGIGAVYEYTTKGTGGAGATGVSANAPAWFIIGGIVLAVMTVIDKTLKPGELQEKHEWFENRFGAFIQMFQIQRERIIASTHADSTDQKVALLRLRWDKVIELKRIKDEWTFYPKSPPAFQAPEFTRAAIAEVAHADAQQEGGNGPAQSAGDGQRDGEENLSTTSLHVLPYRPHA